MCTKHNTRITHTHAKYEVVYILRSNWDKVEKGKHSNTNRKASQIEQLAKSYRLSECCEDWDQMQMQ